MGRDIGIKDFLPEINDFNPLSPHGERLAVVIVFREPFQFQSTLPAWGETLFPFYFRNSYS